MKRRLSLIVIALLCVTQQFNLAVVAQDRADERARNFDMAEDEEDLNRELWEYARRTPYAEVVRYVAAAQARAQATRVEEAVLPTGWRLAPAGQQVAVGRLPYEAVPFAGRLVVLNTGYYNKEPQELSVVDPATGQVTKTVRLNSLFPSAQTSADGNDLYVSGGFEQKVYRLDREFNVARAYTVGGYAAGLAVLDHERIAVLYLATKDAQGNYVAGRLALLNTTDGRVERETDAGYFPYAVRYTGGKLYVTGLGENRLLIFDARLNLLREFPLGRRPQEMCVDGARLYVVNTDSDELSVIDTRRDRSVSTISVRNLGSRFGSAPTSCAVAGARLYVTLAGLNAVAVLDKRTGRQLGLVPTGWYPTKVLLDGERLLVLNAKGIRARRPNPQGPHPLEGRNGTQYYVLTLLQGSLSIVPRAQVERRLGAWTRQVLAGVPLYDARHGLKLPIRYVFYIIKENRSYDQVLGDLGRGDGDASLTIFGRDITPNHHALAEQFVTLDNFYADGEISVLGHSFTTSGYASPFLEWFGNASYSNRYKGYPFGMVPAVTSPAYLWDALDEARVSYRIYGENYFLYTRAWRIISESFGPQSAMAQKFYAQMMRHAAATDRGKEFYNFANRFDRQADTPQDALRLLGQSEFTNALSRFLVGDETLAGALSTNENLRRRFADYLSHYAFAYRSWDLEYSDLDRFAVWRADFERQLQAHRLPQFNYIWLPNDHTDGSRDKIRTPYQFVAQNDAALGKLIETISHSAIWRESLILVEEDDAQNGPDHVDATREVALAAGPFIRRGVVAHDRYDQLSALRTIELLLGLNPLNLNDRMAAPMFGIFNERPDLTPYTPTAPSSTLADVDRKRYDELK